MACKASNLSPNILLIASIAVVNIGSTTPAVANATIASVSLLLAESVSNIWLANLRFSVKSAVRDSITSTALLLGGIVFIVKVLLPIALALCSLNVLFMLHVILTCSIFIWFIVLEIF